MSKEKEIEEMKRNENEAIAYMELFEDKGLFSAENILNVPNLKVISETQVTDSDNSIQKIYAAESLIDKLLKKWYNLSDYTIGETWFGIAIILLVLNGIGKWILPISINVLILIVSLLIMTGKYFSTRIYSSRRGIHKKMYSLDYNNNVIEVKTNSFDFDYNGKIIAKCSDPKTEYPFFPEYDLEENELFENQAVAVQKSEEIINKRIYELSKESILNDETGIKALKFLNSSLYRKYADYYYRELITANHINIHDFLMNRQSFLDFCRYIKEKEAEREKYESEKAITEKNENKLINEIENLI